jgi:hypothetical protein
MFVDACDQHDLCYMTNGGPGSTDAAKAACDSAFLTAMDQTCAALSSTLGPVVNAINQAACRQVAKLYYAAVEFCASGPFYAADPTARAGDFGRAALGCIGKGIVPPPS